MKRLKPPLYTLYIYALLAFAASGCEKITLAEPSDPTDPSEPINPPEPSEPSDSSTSRHESLWAENDTARFYVWAGGVRHVKLNDYPTPQKLIRNPRYRMPTRLESVKLLKRYAIPDGYWRGDQRILCYDSPSHRGEPHDGSTEFGSGLYYTFVPFGSVTRAGFQTPYCLLPIRSERKSGAVDTQIEIGLNDHWANGEEVRF